MRPSTTNPAARQALPENLVPSSAEKLHCSFSFCSGSPEAFMRPQGREQYRPAAKIHFLADRSDLLLQISSIGGNAVVELPNPAAGK
jgi:hypothetical protein